MEIDHKYDRKILSQNEELAKIRKEKRLDKRLEARVSKIEDDTAEMKNRYQGNQREYSFSVPIRASLSNTISQKKTENTTGTTTNPSATAKYC